MEISERPQSPYVGLAPFSEKDSPFFFGRDRECEIITANLRAARLTLFYGPSGVGKSSVLRAGVIYQLRELAKRELEEYGMPSFAIAYYKSWAADLSKTESQQDGDPIKGIADSVHQAIQDALQDSSLEAPSIPASSDMTKLFAAWQERFNLELLIILDQFEEYFLYRSNEDGEGTFATEFSKLVNRVDLPVRFLVSMREDSIAKMDKFKGKIPILFDNRLQIEHMGIEAAREAIEKPVERYNQLFQLADSQYKIEPGLTDEVLNQIRGEKIAIGSTGQGKVEYDESQSCVQAPYVQLVMRRIWEEEVKAKSLTLRNETFLKKLGGATNIVRTHLDAAMDQLSKSDQSAASKFFHYLVTPAGAKIAHTTSSLSVYTKLSEEELTPVLEKLSASKDRILNPVSIQVGSKQQSGYEVYHDALAPAILDWRARYKDKVTLRRTWTILIILFALFLALGVYAYQKEGEVSHEQILEIQQKAQDDVQDQVEELQGAVVETEEELEQKKNLLQQRTDSLGDSLKETESYQHLFESLVRLGSSDISTKQTALEEIEVLAKELDILDMVAPLIKAEVAKGENAALAQQVQRVLSMRPDPKVTEEKYKQLPPRIYIHISNESQRGKAEQVEDYLEANGYVVPGIEVVGVRLSSNELRYFRRDPEEKEIVSKAFNLISTLGVTGLNLRYLDLGDTAQAMKPKHYELWFKSGALVNDNLIQKRGIRIRVQ